MISWKAYVKENIAGKKLGKNGLGTEMKRLSTEYKKMKSGGEMPMSKAEEKVEEPTKTPEPAPAKAPKKPRRRIDFSKIHWGAFTDDWMSHGGRRKFSTLEEFSKDVLRHPTQYEPIVVKRARFYKNILVKGKGLFMI